MLAATVIAMDRLRISSACAMIVVWGIMATMVALREASLE